MAFPTAVNSQITDAVTQSNVKSADGAPAMAAMADLFQATAQSMAKATYAAMEAQQQMAATAMAATSEGMTTLLALQQEMVAGMVKPIGRK